MSEMRVACYSGQRADERPLRFFANGNEYRVEKVDDRWYSPDATYFRVTADDGNLYVLRHDERQDVWTMEAFRARGSKVVEETGGCDSR
ncbi:MAG TPA: hypothetical protein VGS59_10500 [Candidatus Acidoferrales bacterium]|nr:hypothetical protein [Candidatus Acidoferrales bacterium]